jgi:hypothetical protein
LERDVAGHQRPVDQGTTVPDADVVADVRADHEEVVVADPGVAPPLRGPAMHRHVLAEDVLVADPEAGRLAAITLVLGALAQHGAMAHEVVAPIVSGPLRQACPSTTQPATDVTGPSRMA